MALTYSQSAALMKDPTFIDRVKVAALKFANYIVNEATITPQHHARLNWAHGVFAGPDSAAQNIAASAVMDPQVQTDGSAVSDANLQTSVETVVNNYNRAEQRHC